VGDPDSVRRALDDLIASTGADEMMVTTFVHGHEDRLKSYQLVADTTDLPVATPR
jgi:alkanesulfonate monooxygenase SsuD/methylene tetrahydromethanopterin reductase-like flavin-dependent oxidoreductase (luciferase family)